MNKVNTTKMRVFNFTVIVASIIALMSCGGSIATQPANAEGFGAIEKEIKSKFGENAYYTDLTIMYINGIGNTVSATITDDPESLKMGQWNLAHGSWTQDSEITLEVPEDTKAADFMFQLDEDFSVSKLGGLIEKSSKQLTAEKGLENPILSIASIKFPNDGDISKAEYMVRLEPENGGTSFTFSYLLNGEFIEMNY
jgi:hypothetical protein